MQLIIKKEVEETIEVEFPVYKKYGGLNKVISPDTFICVDSFGSLSYNQKCPKIVMDIFSKGEIMEPSVFNNAFQDALSKFNQLDSESTCELVKQLA